MTTTTTGVWCAIAQSRRREVEICVGADGDMRQAAVAATLAAEASSKAQESALSDGDWDAASDADVAAAHAAHILRVARINRGG